MHSLPHLHARPRGNTLKPSLPRESERKQMVQSQATQGWLAGAHTFLSQGPVFFASYARKRAWYDGQRMSASGIGAGVADEPLN